MVCGRLHCQYSFIMLFTFYSESEITPSPLLDNPHLILLFYLTQLFLRELVRSYHLLKLIPIDNKLMSGYFGKDDGNENLFVTSPCAALKSQADCRARGTDKNN